MSKCWCGCNSMCFCVLGCMLACCFVLLCFEGLGWIMSATCVLWYLPPGNMGLSKHGDPVSSELCPLNQNVAHVWARGKGGY